MGFSLESMIAELQDILNKEQKAAKTVRQTKQCLAEWKKYANDCGQLGEKPNA